MTRTFSFKHRLRLELRLALGSPAGGLAFVALLAACSAALWVGFAEVSAQQTEIDRALAQQADQRAENYPAGFEPKDAGTVAYELFQVATDPPGPWAFIALGTRGGANVLQRVRMLGLEAQIHDGELIHPELAAAGNFDFAFVVIFLLPLALIASLHDLRSTEAESGRLLLLDSTVLRLRRFWALRAGVRLALVLVATIVPLLVAVIATSAPLLRLPWVVLAILAYAVLWTLVSCAMALRRGATSIGSAVTLLSIWSFVVLVLPGVAGALATQIYPAEQGAEIVLAQRKSVNDAWDVPKEATFRDFFVHHPEWKDTPPVTTRFHWKWYYAFHEVGDRSVAPEVTAYEHALSNRERLVETASVVVPSLALQRILTATAETDVSRRWAHRAAIRNFHADLRARFYPLVFDVIPFSEDDFRALPSFDPAPRQPRLEPVAFAGLWILTVLIAGLLAGVRRAGERSLTMSRQD